MRLLFPFCHLCLLVNLSSGLTSKNPAKPTAIATEARPWAKRASKALQYCESRTLDFSSGQLPSELIIENGGSVQIFNNTLILRMLEDPQLGFASSVTLLDGPLYFQYGSISASVRVQPVVGIIYSFILRANGTEEGRDEIDLEWLGKDPEHVQSNIFSNGHVIYNKYNEQHPVPRKISDWNIYTINWDEDSIEWAVNGVIVRQYQASTSWNPNVTDWIFPVSPMRLEFGLWDALATGSRETIKWAGGRTAWETLPEGILMEIRNIKINCQTENIAPAWAFNVSSGKAKPAEGRGWGDPSSAVSLNLKCFLVSLVAYLVSIFA